MQHARDYGPSGYEMDDRCYYDQPKISGNELLCYQSSYTYSVQDFNNVTYTWTTSSNLQINGSSTSRTVSVSPTSSSSNSGYVRVSIYISAHSETRVITKDVWLGVPSAPSIERNGEGTIGGNLCQSYFYEWENQFEAVSSYTQGVTQFDWTKLIGTFTWSTSGNDMMLQPNTLGFIGFEVEAQNNCGTSSPSFAFFNVIDCDGRGSLFEYYPNPAKNYLNISVSDDVLDEINANKTIKYELIIYNKNQQIVFSKKSNEKHLSISTRHLPNGFYYLHFKFKETLIREQVIISN